MADKKISALTAGSTLSGTEKIPMVQSSSTVHTTPADLLAYVSPTLQTKIKYAKLSHTVASGSSGGTFSNGSFQTAPINTEDADADSIVTLSGNAFTLQAGTYQVWIASVVYAVNLHQAKLRNTTDGADTLLGTSEFANQTYTMSGQSIIAGSFTIAGAKTFEVQHRCSATRSTDGWGLDAGFGINNVFRIVEIWKVA